MVKLTAFEDKYMEQKDSAERILKQIPYEIVYSARKTLAVQV